MMALNPVFTIGWQIAELRSWPSPGLRAGERSNCWIWSVFHPQPSAFATSIRIIFGRDVPARRSRSPWPANRRCPEPTTALDVTIQGPDRTAQDRSPTISAWFNADRVAVMYAGRGSARGRAVPDPAHPIREACSSRTMYASRRSAATRPIAFAEGCSSRRAVIAGVLQGTPGLTAQRASGRLLSSGAA